MKALIKVGHSVKMQAKAFNSVDSVDGLEIEVDVKDDEELMQYYEKYQKLVRERSIKNVMESAKDFMKKRAEVFERLEQEDD